MKKIIFQILFLVALFLSAWYILSRINWVELFEIEEHSNKTEKALGNLYWEMIKQSENVITNKNITEPIDSILFQICNANHIDIEDIHLHIVENSQVNAFALPNKHLIIYTNLIFASDNQNELAGVICHELAHIELNHIMKKMIKEVGLAVIFSMTTGNNNGQIIKETIQLLSSTAFDRDLEQEADLKAIEYLNNAKVNPKEFANFLFKLSKKESSIQQKLTWISTHPNSEDRAKYIIEQSKTGDYQDIISPESWQQIIAELNR